MSDDGDAREEMVVPEPETIRANGQEPGDATGTPDGTNHDDDAAETAAEQDAEGIASDPGDAVAGLQAELDDLRAQLLRKSADFDNYRKRMQREKEEFASFANRELLLDIVPIVDDFERAIKSSEESQDFTAFHDGIVMIEKQFTSMLERKWHLRRFDSAGEEFDPQRHEAMMTEEVPGHDRSMVLEDFQKGYLLNDRVLRPAKVKVSMPAPGGNGSSDSGNSDE